MGGKEGPARILIADDDLEIREVLREFLCARYECRAVESAEAALAALARAPFDLVISDITMGDMSGLEMVPRALALAPDTVMIMISGAQTIECAVAAMRAGAFDYLTKPFVRDELRAKIGRALATRRWARDRERLLAVGQTLASSGVMERVLDAVAQATVETTEAERCVVFQLQHGRLLPMASAGSPPPSWSALESAARAAMDKGVPTTFPGSETGAIVAAPLLVHRGPAGALVIETPSRVEPTDDDLELLALFSSQAAVAIRNTHELERLRSGALAALGRMATQVAHELKNPLTPIRFAVDRLRRGVPPELTDAVEVLAIVALLPLAAGVLGMYGSIHGLFGSIGR
jgi:DNA-binding response OmpR family regulator